MKDEIERDWYRDCSECGAKCCRFFGIPKHLAGDIGGEGVPLSAYKSELEPNPAEYFKLREGIEVTDEGFIVVQEGVRTFEINCRLGSYIIVYSKCKELGQDGQCRIYAHRPETCRNFVARTAKDYLVPRGCIFDFCCSYGEDFGL